MKESFWEKIEQRKLYQWMLFFIMMSVIVMGYCLIKGSFWKVNDDFSWVCQVDSIEEQEGILLLSGFAFELGKDAKEENFKIILYDTKSRKGYYPEIEYVSREDVNEYFLCEYDYIQSGFVARIETKNLNLDNRVYEILVQPEGKHKAYAIDTYYANGEMLFVNPNEFVPLDTVGTDLEKITNNGVLRGYHLEHGIYVYQYDGELYWIADENYYFEEDNTTYIQYQLWTTQIENLPQYRQENNWFFDNIGFYFEEKELQDMNTGNYRVAKKELPIEYSIRQIETGYYVDGKWIWQNHFLPYFEFTK